MSSRTPTITQFDSSDSFPSISELSRYPPPLKPKRGTASYVDHTSNSNDFEYGSRVENSSSLTSITRRPVDSSSNTPEMQVGKFADILDLNITDPDSELPSSKPYVGPPLLEKLNSIAPVPKRSTGPRQPKSKSFTAKEGFEEYLHMEYYSYSKYVLVIALHAFVTSFFMLWSLASRSLPMEILATKFFHVVAPFACLHYWILYNYPIHFYATQLGGRISLGAKPKSDGRRNRDPPNPVSLDSIKSRIYNGTALRMFLFFICFAIDLLYFCIKLIPLATVCFDPSFMSGGGTLPIECSGWEGVTDNNTLFVVTFVVDLIQIILGLTVIIMTYFTQPKLKRKEKDL